MSSKLMEVFQGVLGSAKAKFDETCEGVFNLKVAKSDKPIRGFVDLPYAHGKKIKVLIFSNNNIKDSTEDDTVISEGSLPQIKTMKLDFDVAVADLEMMPKLSAVAKILGPKGLMPNSKDGCVTKDVNDTLSIIKHNRLKLASDKNYGVHFGFGKLSIGAEKLSENFRAAFDAILKLNPNPGKKDFVVSCYVVSIMGKAYNIDISEL